MIIADQWPIVSLYAAVAIIQALPLLPEDVRIGVSLHNTNCVEVSYNTEAAMAR